MKSWFFLNIIIGEGSAVFELLSSKDESLLIWGNSFFILNLSLDIFNGVSWFNIKSNSFTCKCFYENLHFYFALFEVLLIIIYIIFYSALYIKVQQNYKNNILILFAIHQYISFINWIFLVVYFYILSNFININH